MTNKCHSVFIALVIACAAISVVAADGIGSAWYGSPVGRCYESIQEYLIMSFGSEYQTDDNIKVVEVKPSVPAATHRNHSHLMWVLDTTPGVNVTRTLFRVESSGKSCAVLYAPLSSSISLSASSHGELPVRITTQDSPPAGFEGNRVVYKLDSLSGTYAPMSCLKVSKAGAQRRVSCSRAFSD